MAQRRARSSAVSRRRVLKLGLVAGTVGALAAARGVWDGTGDGHPKLARSATRVRRAELPTTPPPTSAPAPTVRDIIARWVVEENALPGTAGWNIPVLGDQHAIEGYFDTVSANVGDTVHLYASTHASSYHIEAYRMGWYQGLGGRLVWSSPEIPGALQAEPVIDGQTNMVDASWTNPYPVNIAPDFPPGCYLFKLVSSDGPARFVPLTVRDDASTSAYLFMNAVTTWQAYNEWGGYSLYFGASRAGHTFANRARVVSFDRPYEVNGAPMFLSIELPLVHLIERLGLDISYATNVDVHRDPQKLLAHQALISTGHDEYYSNEMRTALESARDHGVNLAFLGANAIFRQHRFQDSNLGSCRHEVCYKSASEDPLSRTSPELTTVNWRDPPVNRPENQLIGNQYESNPVLADMVITQPDSWVFANTGLQQGDRLPQLVSGEYDRYSPGPGVPDGVEILAHSPVVCQGRASYADMTYYTAPSGAGVFDTGTQGWVGVLAAPNGTGAPGPSDVMPAAVEITTNILTTFGRGPAAHTNPAQPNATDGAQPASGLTPND